jgi:membrane fusion protein, multidrug efflux system
VTTPCHRFRRIGLFLALCLILLAGCAGEDEGGSPQARGPGHGGPHGGGRPPEQAVPVAVQDAGQGVISSYYDATASLEAEKTAEVLARVTGTVEAISAEEGDLVNAGGALLSVDNDEYRYRVEQAEANTANLLSRFKRMEAMRAEDLSSEEEFQSSLSELENARAEEGLARLTLSYTMVAAPFRGRVTNRLVDVGQNVSVGTPLFELSDFDPLLARVHVPSREFNQLQRDQDVDLVLDSDGTRLKGRIKLISPVIDPASGTIKITVEVDDYPAGVRPGDFAAVRIVTERREGVTLVPRGAVLTDKGETVVYVPIDGEGEDAGVVAERRIVETGFTDDDHTEIVTGLVSGETVVVKGQRSLKHGTPLKILETGEAGTR